MDPNQLLATISELPIKVTLLNGTVFDQSNSAVFTLSNLIVGWQQALPLIGIGGSIKIYLPPSLAYGNKASGSIPANSNLIFEIDLLGF
ncbi:MAG: FKBP-type peptidyl-prolyl cis-trans isomerase [Bacteroidetes bacterium]|nr:FKBP-type peptidyl-prolyl cis-trans isomerase [Bacteroidota bacterium]